MPNAEEGDDAHDGEDEVEDSCPSLDPKVQLVATAERDTKGHRYP